MTRKIVQTGSSLAVTLPKEVVERFKLRKGDSVDVSVHPQTGAIVVRTGVRSPGDLVPPTPPPGGVAASG
jgi:antitoxin component of MazEF toxin-antitoxin module